MQFYAKKSHILVQNHYFWWFLLFSVITRVVDSIRVECKKKSHIGLSQVLIFGKKKMAGLHRVLMVPDVVGSTVFHDELDVAFTSIP